MYLKNFWRSCLALMAVMTIAGAAGAQTVFFSDNFNAYADGTALTSANWVAHSGSGVGPILVTGGKAVANQGVSGQTEDDHRDTGQSLAPGGNTWYYSAKITVTDIRPTPGTGVISPVYFMHFMEANPPAGVESQFRARVYVLPSSDEGKFRLGISSGTKTLNFPTDPDFDNDNDVDGRDLLRWQANYGAGPGATNGTGDADDNDFTDDVDFGIWKSLYGYPPAIGFNAELDFGTTYTVVASYTSDDDDTNALLTSDGFASLWVNPVDVNSTKVTDTVPNANIALDATRPQAWLAIRQGTTGLQNGPARVDIDSVAIGSNFGDVLAALNPSGAAVPEPASWALAAIVAAAAGVRRRGRGAV